MDDDRGTGDRYQVTTGDVSGQMLFGSHNRAVQVQGPAERPTEAQMEELRQAFADLRALVEAEAPPERKDEAVARAKELEEAVTAEKPDLSTMEYVKGWFARNLPKLAGAVASIVVHPIVGQLVQAAGETVVAEFRRRFPGSGE